MRRSKKLRKNKQSEKSCIYACKQNGFSLKNVIDQTDKICEVAVNQNGLALELVWDQTESICEIAVAQNGLALQFVKIQTERICEAAVNQNGLALQYVKIQTDYICEIAVNQNGLALQYVTEQTPNICEIAVKQTGTAFKYVVLISHGINNVDRDYWKIQDQPYLDYECSSDDYITMRLVVRYGPRKRETIDREFTYRLGLSAVAGVNGDTNLLYLIDNEYKSSELFLAAVKHGLSLYQVDERLQTQEICETAILRPGEPYIPLFGGEPIKRTDFYELEYARKKFITSDLLHKVFLNNPTYLHHRIYECLKPCRPYSYYYDSKYDPLLVLNKLAWNMITDICIALSPMGYPPYVLFEIIDLVLYKNTLSYAKKTNHIIKVINNLQRFC